jgi:hypothetical protein
MRFFGLGRRRPTQVREPPAPAGPPRLTVDKRGVIYVDPSCPNCGHVFDPPPTRRRACPSCKKLVVYDRGSDDLVRLVRDGEAKADDEWVRSEAARQALFDRKDGRPLRQLNEEILKTYAALGIRVRVVGEASCRPCRQVAGTYDANRAPILPLVECQSRPNRICVCRYEPTASSGGSVSRS